MFGEKSQRGGVMFDELAMQNLLMIVNSPVIWSELDQDTKNKLIRVTATYAKKSVNALLEYKPFNQEEVEETKKLFT